MTKIVNAFWSASGLLHDRLVCDDDVVPFYERLGGPYSTLLPGGITTASTPPTIDLSEMLNRCAVGQRGVSVARRYALSVSVGEVAPSGCS